MAYRYRDRVTKQFVSAATWKRSLAHGGVRYKRERVAPSKKLRAGVERVAKKLRERPAPKPEKKKPGRRMVEIVVQPDSPGKRRKRR